MPRMSRWACSIFSSVWKSRRLRARLVLLLAWYSSLPLHLPAGATPASGALGASPCSFSFRKSNTLRGGGRPLGLPPRPRHFGGLLVPALRPLAVCCRTLAHWSRDLPRGSTTAWMGSTRPSAWRPRPAGTAGGHCSCRAPGWSRGSPLPPPPGQHTHPCRTRSPSWRAAWSLCPVCAPPSPRRRSCRPRDQQHRALALQGAEGSGLAQLDSESPGLWPV